MVYVATLETSHFSFLAVGKSAGEAKKSLHRGWFRHKQATGAALRWIDIRDDVNVQALELGSCSRDGSVIYRKE